MCRISTQQLEQTLKPKCEVCLAISAFSITLWLSETELKPTIAMSIPPPSPSSIEREIRAIFSSPSFNLENETQKSIRKKVTKRLKLGEFPSDQKSLFKELVTRIVQEQEEEEDDESNGNNSLHDSDDENEDPIPTSKPKKLRKAKVANSGKVKKAAQKKSTSTTKSDAAPKRSSSSSCGSGVQRLLSLGQAMRLGPRLHRGLKDMSSDKERLEALTNRLQEAGASWKGDLPTPRDVANAKAEKQRKDDLDGLDTSVIVEGGRRRRGAVNYAVDVANDEDNEEQDEEERPRKKAKSPKTEDSSGTDEDSDDGDFGSDASEDDESEAEFGDEDD